MLWMKRAGLILLILALFVGLTACSGGDVSSTPTSDPGSTTSETPSGDRPWLTEGFTFGDRNFIVGMPGDWGPKRGISEADDLFLDQIEMVESTYHCTVEYKEFANSSYHDMLASSALSGTYVADVMYTISTNVIPGYAKAGLVISPDEYDIFNYADSKWNKSIAASLTWGGKRYAFSTLAFDSYNDLGAGVWFNKDLFEDNSLTSPYEYYNNDTWTWDAMLELATQLTKDLDGNGEDDQWGIAINDDYYSFLFSNGARLVKQDDSGKWQYTLNSNEAVEALEYFINLSATGVNAPWLGDNTSSRITPFVEGRVGMLVANVSHASTYFEDMSDDYGWVPFPKGPSADTYQLYRSSTSCYIIPAPVENPEQVLQMYDLITDWVQAVDALALYKSPLLCDDESLEILRDAYEGGWNDYDMSNMVSGFKSLTRSGIDSAWGGDVAVKTAVDAVAAAAQQLIDESLNAN